MHIVIIGGSTVGQTLAERLNAEYNELQLIDEDEHVIGWAVEQGISAIAVEDIRESADTLDVDLTTIIVVASARDSANLLIAQHIRNRFDVGRLIVRVNDPQNHSVFAELGLATVHATPVLAAALADAARMVPESDTDEQDLSQEEWV